MRPLTFDQAWIKNGRRLTHARGTPSGRNAPSSDDDYPVSYQRYLQDDSPRSDMTESPRRQKQYHRGEDVDFQRVSARAALKGINAHAKSKVNLVNYAAQHRNAVETLLSSLLSNGVVSASKAASRSLRAATATTSQRSLTRATLLSAKPRSSDDDSDSEEDGWQRDGGRSGLTSGRPVGRGSINTASTATAQTAAAAAASGSSAVGYGQRRGRQSGPPCICGACCSRSGRLAAGAAAIASCGRGRCGAAQRQQPGAVTLDPPSPFASSPRPSWSPSGKDPTCRQLLRAVLTQIDIDDPRVASVPATAAAGSSTATTTTPGQLSFRPRRQANVTGASRAEEPMTPRLTWVSYLSPTSCTAGHISNGGSSSLGPARKSSASAVAVLEPYPSKSSSSDSCGDGGGNDSSSRSQSGRRRSGSTSRSRSRARQSSTGGCFIANAGTRSEATPGSAVLQLQRRRSRPMSPPQGRDVASGGVAGGVAASTRAGPGSGVGIAGGTGPGAAHLGAPAAGSRLASDISSTTDESEREEEEAVQQMLGGAAAWLHERQQERQRQQDMADLRYAARRRAHAAVMGAAAVSWSSTAAAPAIAARPGGYDSDGHCSSVRSHTTSAATSGVVRSPPSSPSPPLPTPSALTQPDMDVGASFTSWIYSFNNSNIIKDRSVKRPKGDPEVRQGTAGVGFCSSRNPPAEYVSLGERYRYRTPVALLQSPPSSATALLARRRLLRSSPGGGNGGSGAATAVAGDVGGGARSALSARESGSAAAALWRSLMWKDAETLVASDTAHRRSRSLGGPVRSSLLLPAPKALSDSSEESFAYRMSSAAVTLRSASAPRYGGGRQYDSTWLRQQLCQGVAAGHSLSRPSRIAGSAGGRQALAMRRGGATGGATAVAAFKGTAAAAAAAGGAVAIAAAPRAASIVSSSSSANSRPFLSGDGGGGGSSTEASNWFMTEVFRTPVGSHLGDREEPRTHGSRSGHRGGGSPGRPPSSWTGSPASPWAQSPSQKLSLSRVWGPVTALEGRASGHHREEGGGDGTGGDGGGRDGYFEGEHRGGRGGLHGSAGSALYATSDDMLWRSPPRPLSSRAASVRAHSPISEGHGVLHPAAGDCPRPQTAAEREEQQLMLRASLGSRCSGAAARATTAAGDGSGSGAAATAAEAAAHAVITGLERASAGRNSSSSRARLICF